MNEIKIKAETPCYVNTADTCGNPYRLTPYVATDGEVWLAAEGNGCANDILLEDINGWTAEEITDKWGEIDLYNLRKGADEIGDAGDDDAAGYIREWADTAEAAKRKAEKTTVYEVWLVENGSLTEFGRGWPLERTATANMCWGDFYSLDEIREKFREWAYENYNRECGPCESADDPEAECEKYVADCVESLNIEWHDDLKWVRCRKMEEDVNGDRTFIEVL